MLIGSASINVSNYLFHIVMGRMLGPAAYGGLASLVAVLYVVSVPVSSVQMACAQMVAEMDRPESRERIGPFISMLNRRLAALSIAGVALVALAGPLIAGFIKVRTSSVFIIGSVALVALVLPSNRGGLHGLKKFGGLSLNMATETLVKLGLGATLVVLGLGLNGALLGMLIGALVALLFSFVSVSRLRLEQRSVPEKPALRTLLAGVWPILAALLAVTFVYNIDVVLVRHFLKPGAAGQYAGLATLGKIAFFAPLAVSAAMFPISSQAGVDEAAGRRVLYQAMLLTAGISLGVDMAYFMAPRLVVGVLIGARYMSIAPYLGLVGLGMSFLAISNCYYYYELSRKRTGFIGWLIGVAVLEVLFITLAHWGILPVVMAVFVSSLILLLGVLGGMILQSARQVSAGAIEVKAGG